MGKMSSKETMECLEISLGGLNKLRLLYREKGRLGDRELFDEVVVREELLPIVQAQRENPRLSFANCYDQVIRQNNLENLVDRIFHLDEEDEVGIALSARFEDLIGAEKNTEFYELFNALHDLLRTIDPTGAEMLNGLQEMVISNAILRTAMGAAQE